MYSISIVIPVYNGGKTLNFCLESVFKSSYPEFECIVVDDHSSDNTLEVAKSFPTKIIQLDKQQGTAHARNRGAEAAQGDILFFIDADVTIYPDSLEKVARAFKDHPQISAIFGSYDDEPFETNFLSQYRNLLHHYVHQTSNREASTFWGACGAIRREVFLKMGGFDNRYNHPSIEDIELGYRLKKAGYKTYLLKEIQVKHLKYWGILSLLKADIFFRALPWTDLILNEGRFIDDLNLKISSRISVVSVFVLALTFIGLMFAPRLWIAMVFLMVLLFGLNWDLYRFFKNKRGLSFAIKTIPWHWFYFFYSGLAFSFGFAKYQVRKLEIKK
jgi:glycosyltransferase involved in cell wall biosynthesis